ncbi:orotidine 5'-phosphate decarboxylase [Bacillus sp. ISL-35]|uniref:3-hexulose-6-phosphate synthase n=1 Tax=Bacillus sp. ISL-35 TaxID=2819122 RepID=UPI001BE6CB24|nr:3-hexulose-6-phosphate synthase [Bacillus sp. ISL-35]MBT2678784.1 orotidine 5'-phosphate decarboxylase [Bacillus sp. ISL-35]MBT2703776.1 orotidine 5'-phosphate decarboxylase [Chryseobacterium sp. ISL-80]
MKIQLALDRLTREQCFSILEETAENIDRIELGTGVIKEYGMAIVREIRQAYPHKTIVADMKTCDAGRHEAKQAFEAGADIITVMAFSHNKTIEETLAVAQKFGKRVMIDLLGVDSKERTEELRGLGVDLFCLHIGKDMQKEGSLADSSLNRLVEGMEGVEVAIAGGISENTIGLLEGIDIAIVGSAITGSSNPEEASRRLRSKTRGRL